MDCVATIGVGVPGNDAPSLCGAPISGDERVWVFSECCSVSRGRVESGWVFEFSSTTLVLVSLLGLPSKPSHSGRLLGLLLLILLVCFVQIKAGEAEVPSRNCSHIQNRLRGKRKQHGKGVPG